MVDINRYQNYFAIKLILFLNLIVYVARAVARDQGGMASSSVVAAGSTVRVALLSDPHVVGPQYQLGGESNDLDNLSIIKTQQRLWETITSIKAIWPTPDLAVFMGDVVHNGLDYSTDFDTLTSEPINGYHIASSLLAQLGLPTLFGWGNHDYKVRCGDPSSSAPPDLSHRVFDHFFNGSKPYGSVEVGGWKIIMLNSLLGHTWVPSHPECNTRLSSYGSEQLQWLEEQLQEGRPSVVGMHFPLVTSVSEDDMSIVSILNSSSNVKLVISGHFHKGFDWETLYPFPHITLPAIRYDTNNFFLLELYEDETFRLVDADKNRGGARCSDTWTYDIMPAFQNNQSQGDCGDPLVADTPEFVLPPLQSTEDIPPGFNPEASCNFDLATSFLRACTADGATDECCGLLITQFAPTSSWPFASCLCQPSFWNETEQLFSKAGKDAANVMDECVLKTGGVLLRMGQGACIAQ